MRVVLTNDDGIDAPGLAALEEAAAALGATLVVVAPAECHSGCGHRVTTTRAIQVADVGLVADLFNAVPELTGKL